MNNNSKLTKHFVTKIPLGKALLLTFATLVVALVLYNSKDAIFGTKLSVVATTDGATVSEPFLPISGIAKHARALLINGREVAFDRGGTFADGVLLSNGYNIVEVSLKDQFGNTRTRTYHVVLDAPPSVAQANTYDYQKQF